MTFAINGFPSSAPPATPAMNALQALASVPPPTACRKRKGMDGESDSVDGPIERQTGVKGLRKLARMPHAEEQAQFHALPPELNMQLLANLGYNSSMQMPSSVPRDIATFSRISHSPTSSFSDFGGPSTPSDMSVSTESYFTKGMRRESSAAYPDFNIYPAMNSQAPTPGLMGMHMNVPSVGSQDPNGMQMDGMEEQEPVDKHGDHCKSIPQLHVRSEPGVFSELWASCPDCGTMSKVDSPPIGDALSYSP